MTDTLNAMRATARIHWPLLLPLLLEALVFRAWLAPGLIMGDDFLPVSSSLVGHSLTWPHAWNASFDLGWPRAFWSPSFLVWAAAGLFAHLGAPWPLIERVLWLFPFLALAVAGPYVLIFRITRAPLAAAVAASLFSVNTFTIGLAQRGHIPSLVAYALIPFLFLAFLEFMRSFSGRGAITLAGLLTLQVNYDLRYTYITLVIFLAAAAVKVVYDRGISRALRALSALGLLVLALVVFNAYWLLPQIVAPATILPGYDTLQAFVGISYFEDTLHAIALFYPFYHYYPGMNAFFAWPVTPEFLLLPAVVLAALALRWRSPYSSMAVTLIVIGTVIASGPTSEFGVINRFLFTHVPGMKLFRDISKFNAVIAFAYMVAAGLGAARALAWLRRAAPRAHAAGATVGTALVMTAYVFLMRDAFSPMRQSIFAQTAVPPSSQKLQRFLDAQPDFFRVMVFPLANGSLDATDRHPVVNAEDFAMSYQGFADLNPHETDILEFFASPLVPDLLRELDVRYIVVSDDPFGSLYRPYNFPVQHQEAVRYFAHVPWLHNIGEFGANIIFRVAGRSAPRAFIAPYPTLFDGAGPSPEALAGSALWSERGAVVMAEQVKNPADVSWIRNIVQAPVLLDYGARPYARSVDELTRQFLTMRPINALGGVFHAAAFSRAGMTDTLTDWNGYPFFKNSFRTYAASRARLHIVMSREVLPSASYIENDFASTKGVIAVNPSGTEYLYPAGRVDVQATGLNVSPASLQDLGQGAWLQIRGAVASLTVVNAAPIVQTADIRLPSVVSPDLLGSNVRMEMSGVEKTYFVPGHLLGWVVGGGRSIVLKSVKANPGVNFLTITVLANDDTVATAYRTTPSLFIRTDIVAENVEAPVAPPIPRLPLPLAVTPRAGGTAVDSLATADARFEQVGEFTIFDHLDLPLDVHPTIRLEYVAPPSPLALDMIAGLRRHRDGKRFLYYGAPPVSGTGEVDLFSAVQSALDGMWGQAIKQHAMDPIWLREYWLAGSGAASDYTVTSVRGVLIKPLGIDASGALGGHFVTLLKDAKITLGIPAKCGKAVQTCSPLTTLPVAEQLETPIDFASLASGASRASGLELLSTVASAGQIRWQLRGVNFARSIVPRTVRQQLALTIPARGSADALYLAFDTCVPFPYEMKLALGYATPGSIHDTVVFPNLGRPANASEDAIPPEWISPPHIFESPDGVPLAVPIDLRSRSAGETWLHYRLDLRAIRNYRLADRPHAKLRDIYFSFAPKPGTQANRPDVVTVKLANLTFVSSRRSRTSIHFALSRSPVMIDGAPVGIARIAAVGYLRRIIAESQPIELEPGEHTIASLSLAPFQVDTALLEQGTPSRAPAADVSDFHELSSDEYVGDLTSRGGLLVLPVAFSPYWRLAVLPATGPKPSGCAWCDALRFHREFLADDRHMPVNYLLNGWRVPAGRAKLLFLYVPQAYNQLATILCLIASAALVTVVLRKWR